MENQAGGRLVHHFDVERRRVLCGAAVGEDHSTKHTRGITCDTCRSLLEERADERARGGGAGDTHASV